MSESKGVRDIVVVGGGASGLTAGLFAARRNRKTMIISQDIGGQASTTPDIENYPGFEFVDGLDLMKQFKSQAVKYGAEFIFETVHKLEKLPDGNFRVHANSFSVDAKSVVLAFGLSHRHLGVPGEDKFTGTGVMYCSVCDTRLYKNQPIAVVGGGSSAVQAALLLAKDAKTVTIINLTESLRAEPVVMNRLKDATNITVINSAATKEVVGDKEVTGIVIEHADTKKIETIPVHTVFVEIGYWAKTDWIKGLIETDARGQIITKANCETSQTGIFAAGDITTITFKQVVISAGEGAKAALEADQYLFTKEGKRGVRIDWGLKKK